MIAFRQCDARCPFLWEGAAQPEGRWHAAGEGPAHYFADTPDGAWADFLRHEEIRDAADLATIRRAIWAVDIGDAAPAVRISRRRRCRAIARPGPPVRPPRVSCARPDNAGRKRHPPRCRRGMLVLYGNRQS